MYSAFWRKGRRTVRSSTADELGVTTLGVTPAPRVAFDVRASSVPGAGVEDLIAVARRDNPKRAVLLVSRVLGKHLTTEPSVALAAGAALGEAVRELVAGEGPRTRRESFVETLVHRAPSPVPRHDVPDETGCLVVGFCETAIALGHLVRQALGVGPIAQSTRLPVAIPALVRFEESHSHAQAHRVHHYDPDLFDTSRPVVLVDDELTTGRTALDLIKAIHARWPRERYVIAALVDWRDGTHARALAAASERLGTTIEVVSLLSGTARIDDQAMGPIPDSGATVELRDADVACVIESGMPSDALTGWNATVQRTFDDRALEAAEKVEGARSGDRALVLGTEELMFAPMVLAGNLAGSVSYRSTTRSPIVPANAEGYPITDRADFPTLDGAGMRHLYNLDEDDYDDVFVVAPRGAPTRHPLYRALRRSGRTVNLVTVG